MNTDWEKELQKVKRVETPPFLLTRIEAKIEAYNAQKAPLNWVYGLVVTSVVVFVINVFSWSTYFNADPLHSEENAGYTETIQLRINNQLYND